jgi:hypothetical protein
VDGAEAGYRLAAPSSRYSVKSGRHDGPDDVDRMPDHHQQHAIRVRPRRQEQNALRIVAGQDSVRVAFALPIGRPVDDDSEQRSRAVEAGGIMWGQPG